VVAEETEVKKEEFNGSCTETKEVVVRRVIQQNWKEVAKGESDPSSTEKLGHSKGRLSETTQGGKMSLATNRSGKAMFGLGSNPQVERLGRGLLKWPKGAGDGKGGKDGIAEKFCKIGSKRKNARGFGGKGRGILSNAFRRKHGSGEGSSCDLSDSRCKGRGSKKEVTKTAAMTRQILKNPL